MSDFEGIPAVGDIEDKDDGLEGPAEGDSEEENEQRGKYRFNGKHIYVTWSRSTFEDKELFHEKLRLMLGPRVRMFGGKEFHQDGTPHYHVVFSFEEKQHFSDAAKNFMIDGDTTAIRFEKPKPRQPIGQFLENTMAYCAKDGDTFGERLSLEGAAAEQRKRKWQEVIDEEDEQTGDTTAYCAKDGDTFGERLSLEGAAAEQRKRKWQEVIDEKDGEKAWRLVRELDPRAYMVNHPALAPLTIQQTTCPFCCDARRVRPSFRII